tara:strand:- start:486 stop:713 length:228 start_codon:yes stop_codon:yes gene_type:complete
MCYLTEEDSSFSVKKCDKCNNVYEIIDGSKQSIIEAQKTNKWSNVFNIYKDFPTIGLERKKCPKCKKGEEDGSSK